MGFQACVPAVDTGTQQRLAVLDLEASNPGHCPAVHAESLYNFNHMSLDQLEARDKYQAAQCGPGMCLDFCLARDELTLRGSARAAQECRPMD